MRGGELNLGEGRMSGKSLAALVLGIASLALAGAAHAQADPLKDAALARIRDSFKVDGISLLDSHATHAARMGVCAPSIFAGLKWCVSGAVEEKKGAASYIKTTGYNIDAEDRIVYAISSRRSYPMKRDEFDGVIQAIGERFGAGAAVYAFRKRNEEAGEVNSLIAVWGGLRLVHLTDAEYAVVESGGSLKRGHVVDHRFSLVASAKQRDPIYRIEGAAGFILHLTATSPDRADVIARAVYQPVFLPAPGKLAAESTNPLVTDSVRRSTMPSGDRGAAADEQAQRMEAERALAAERLLREDAERKAAEEKAARVEAERKAADERREFEEEKKRLEAERKVAEGKAANAEGKAASAEEKAASAEGRAASAEERAQRAEAERKVNEERRQKEEAERKVAEGKAAVAEGRAASAEGKAASAEERAKRAERERMSSEERRRSEEAERKSAEERARRAEVERKALEERRRKEEVERKAAEERAQRAEAERKAVEERRQKEEAERKSAEERAKRAEDERKALEERGRKEEAERKAAEERRAAEQKRAEVEAERKAAEEKARRAEAERADRRRSEEADRAREEGRKTEDDRDAAERKAEGQRLSRERAARPESWHRLAADAAKTAGAIWSFAETQDRVAEERTLRTQTIFGGAERLAVEVTFECTILGRERRLRAVARGFDRKSGTSVAFRTEGEGAFGVRTRFRLDDQAPQDGFLFRERQDDMASILEIPMTSVDLGKKAPRASIWLRHYVAAVDFNLVSGTVAATITPYAENLRRVLEACAE